MTTTAGWKCSLALGALMFGALADLQASAAAGLVRSPS
jgi:hypothetical protein